MWLRVIGIAVVTVGLAACNKAVKDHRGKQPLAELAGSEWQPVGIEGDQFVAFKMAGELVGSGGCNNFFGTYALDGQALTIGPLAATKKMCAEGMDAEAEFLGLLQAARKIEATHAELTLYGEDGIKVLELRRRDWD